MKIGSNLGNAINQRIARQNSKMLFARQAPGKCPRSWLSLKRLNVESATRRSLVGAKGMRP